MPFSFALAVMNVHSSIFNSNQRLPSLAWKQILIGAFSLFIIFVAVMELRLAAKGFRPSIVDSERLWSHERSRARALGERALIVIGGSRIQLGMDLDVLRQKTGLEPVQLAIDGSPPLPILEGLANDSKIRGIIIVDYYDHFLHPASSDDRAKQYEKNFVRLDHSSQFLDYETMEGYLTSQVRQSLRSYADGATPLASLMTRIFVRYATPQYLITLPNRSRMADYRKVPMPDFYYQRVIRNLGQQSIDIPQRSTYNDVKAILEEKINQLQPSSNTDYLSQLGELEKMIQEIHKRQGRVLFVVIPSSGLVREIERKRFPRSLFWNQLVSQTSAKTVHFEDFSSLNSFVCPDGSHLDYRDRAAFTTAFIDAAGLGKP